MHYICKYAHTCIYIYYANLKRNSIVRISHHRSGNSQGRGTFLASSVDNQTCNYDTECSNHHSFQSP